MPVVNYLWNPLNDNIVREFDDDGNVIADYTTEARLHGNVISQRRNGVDSVYHYDGQGSTIALTNAAGDVTDTYSYNAFGEVIARTGDTVNPFQFIGQKQYYRDAETGEYEVRQRPLTPYGRWLSIDPISVQFGNLQFYVYVRNSPLTSIDPTGLAPAAAGPGAKKCPASYENCSYGQIDASALWGVGPREPITGPNWSAAEGVGIAIGFKAKVEGCARCCTEFGFIQVFFERLTDPPGPDKIYQFHLDASNKSQPWYGGTVLPPVPGGRPIDESRYPAPIREQFKVPPYDVVMFDRPNYTEQSLCLKYGLLGPKSKHERYFEACVICKDRGELLPLGCVSYGYSRSATAKTVPSTTNPDNTCRFGPPIPFGPRCLGSPSIAFIIGLIARFEEQE